jgi:phosphatidate cytidylyltransferase
LLRWRLISAAIIVSVLLALHWLDFRQVGFGAPGTWLFPLLILVSALATEELLSLVRGKGHQPLAWVAYAGNVIVPLAVGWPIVARMTGLWHQALANLDPLGPAVAALALVTGLVLVGEMLRFERPGRAVVDAALALFAVCYIGLLISFWTLLRLHHSNAWGMTALFSMLLVTKMADTGAFAVGKQLGRNKLTPVLSPGKTWEGAIGGIVTAAVTSWLFFRFGAPLLFQYDAAAATDQASGAAYLPPSLGAALVYGVLLALAGMIGDLAESLIKRDMERKDSSSWLRGLGGVLDIIDAPLIAGPVAWLCWTCGLLGP